jgi:hypothetical protein
VVAVVGAKALVRLVVLVVVAVILAVQAQQETKVDILQ